MGVPTVVLGSGERANCQYHSLSTGIKNLCVGIHWVWVRHSKFAASQVHGSQFAAGFVDGYVRLFDIRTSEIHGLVVKPGLTFNQSKELYGLASNMVWNLQRMRK
ncbi:Regulatory-associated protein of TOR [Orobanche minor]